MGVSSVGGTTWDRSDLWRGSLSESTTSALGCGEQVNREASRNRFTVFKRAGLALIFVLSFGCGITGLPSLAGHTAFAKQHEANKGGVRVDDLPKPIPGFMKTIQGIGNRVGKEISKATSKGATAIKKAVKKDPGERGQKAKR